MRARRRSKGHGAGLAWAFGAGAAAWQGTAFAGPECPQGTTLTNGICTTLAPTIVVTTQSASYQVVDARIQIVPGNNADEPVTVHLTGLGAATERECVLPCQTDLPSGSYTASVRGPREFTAALAVPQGGSLATVNFLSVRNIVRGSVLLGVGGVLAISSAPLILGGLALQNSTSSYSSTLGSTYLALGAIGAIAGVALAVPGIVFLARIGRNQIEVERPGLARTARRRPSWSLTGVGVSPLPDGGAWAGASLVF